MTSPDDRELLKRVLGERARLLAYIRAIVRRRDVAEDVFQDLCVLVCQKRPTVAEVRDLPAWLRASARNLARNAVRHSSNRTRLLGDEVLDLLDDAWADVAGGGGAADYGDALEACQAKLAPAARELLRARYADGVDVETLAGRLGRPAASLRTTFSRIYKTLAECIFRRVGRPGTRHD